MAVLFNDKWRQCTSPPAWLTEVIYRILDDSMLMVVSNKAPRRNIRLFFTRLLMNQPVTAIVAYWSGDLIRPVIQCCLNDIVDQNSSSTPQISYFIRDVIFILLDQWKDAPVDHTAIELCSSFACYLISAVYHSNNDIRADNLKCVSMLIIMWSKKGQIMYEKMESKLRLPLLTLLQVSAQPTGGRHAR